MKNSQEVDLTLIDRILLHLYDHPSTPCMQLRVDVLSSIDVRLTRDEEARIQQYLRANNLAEERESLIGGDVCITLSDRGRQIIAQHRTWSAYLRDAARRERRTKQHKWIDGAGKIVGLLIAIATLGWGVYKGVQATRLAKELEKANAKIELLETKVDSLLRP